LGKVKEGRNEGKDEDLRSRRGMIERRGKEEGVARRRIIGKGGGRGGRVEEGGRRAGMREKMRSRRGKCEGKGWGSKGKGGGPLPGRWCACASLTSTPGPRRLWCWMDASAPGGSEKNLSYNQGNKTKTKRQLCIGCLRKYHIDVKGAQAWDIQSLGFSWFLHH
jgi:hypothetical protein